MVKTYLANVRLIHCNYKLFLSVVIMAYIHTHTLTQSRQITHYNPYNHYAWLPGKHA